MEFINSPIKGIYRDIITGPDDRIIEDRGWVNNTIVTRCRVLLAGFMKNEPSGGIQYMAVGRGLDAWDVSGAPAPDPATTTNLQTPFATNIPVANLALVYLDGTDTEVATPTSRLQITATLPPGYPAALGPLTTYPLREFGLFGRVGGTDYMINCIRHPVILKDVSTTLFRIVRLYF